ncbi:universal stress protein [Mucilaginibacter sp. FT3.2]|uniref:universal stress protein n=1 Tax=Mucilaginibacter sp. FT3.2 TaxID=2723090 RepID=UPI001609AD1C|nr:universal stress protein [Mucilaginibacter sp. FT3.2]MBB6232823.1 nucleotide-binding universal stress UspA family protein [Mucilaginibacter sp. FT3.2]
MKKVLIPIDFTRSSNNAISYAVALSEHSPIKQIILVVNVYITEFEQLIPSADFIQFTMDKAQALNGQLKTQFEDLKSTLLKRLKPEVRVSFILSKMPFLQSIRELIKQEKPDLLVVGSNHSGATEESYISDHLIKVARTSVIPVLIVPALAKYHPIKNALVPFNLSNFAGISLIKRLDSLKNWPHPKLLLLNVDNTPELLVKDDLTCKVAEQIGSHLQSYCYQFYYSGEKDVLKGINHFSYENDLQLIIALPGEHSFLYNLTHRSITKGLARNNYKPVLILKNSW